MKKLTILPIFAVIPALFCTSCFKTSTKTNAEEYLEILQQCRDHDDFHTELYIFPETIEGTEIKSFIYAERSDLFTGSYLLYIVLEYDETGFTPELERIANVKAHFKAGEEKQPIYYPENDLYLTVKQNTRFEYAVYNEETLQIAYVSNQIFDWEETPVAKEFIIPDLSIPNELDDGENMYNMYYLYDGDVGLYVED